MIDAYMATVLDTIARHGWMLQGVGADPDTPGAMSFIYTVGLAGFGHPEMIVFGTPFKQGGAILNHLGDRVRDGERLSPGPVDLGGTHQPWLLEVTDLELARHEYLTVAYRLFEPMPAPLQLVISDKNGRYPWQEECQSPYSTQPLLGPAPE